MLGEVAITPSVFEETSYSEPATGPVYLQMLKEPLLQEVLVRNLHDGEWYQSLLAVRDNLSPTAKELLKKLQTQGRLRQVASCGSTVPSNDVAWCQEALASHARDPLKCVITSPTTKEAFSSESRAASMEKLTSHAWWSARSPSLRLRRTTEDYLLRLNLVLRHANSLMFIDPHLDPTKPQYQEFFHLLARCNRPVVTPLVEIHRVCYFGSGPGREIISDVDWEKRFQEGLGAHLPGFSFPLEVFIWDDFHDRFLITNLMGISLPNGFDVDSTPDSITTWTRLGRDNRDDVQREFDPALMRHALRHRFRLQP